jgi:hypothetical protein
MNRIESTVRTARRRLVIGRFGKALCVTLFAALLLATIGVALPALRVMAVDFTTWVYAWIGGCTLAAVIAAAVYSVVTAPSLAAVAAEVDRRFGLCERLSSSLMLDAEQRRSAFATALISDADRRAGQLEVADRFSLWPSRLGWLPISIVPILAIVLLLVEPASPSNASNTAKAADVESKQVRTVAEQLKQRIQQQRRKVEADGLKEAQELFEKMEADLDKIVKRQDLSRQDAMIQMNDLKKQLEERREQLGSSEQMRRALAQMKGLDAGPGEQVAKSIEQGNFGKAEELVKQLASKIREGALSEQEKEQLKKQIEQMKAAMNQAAQQHEQEKQELQRKIDQARNEGRGDDAAKMQQQLHQLAQKDAQMQQMGQMAEAMSQAAAAMQQGDASQAADALEQLADRLGEMQSEMSELEDLESALDQLSQSKDQMRCRKCGGAGCRQCQGNGMGQGVGDGQGFGLGRGSGEGDRPEQEEDTNTYETQVRGQVKQGRAVIAGFADGANRKGVTREDVKQAIESTLSQESDPAENQTLPRTEREHSQQYFDRLREGD